MPKTSNGSADVTITKQTGTVLTVLTNEKYCDANHAFNLSVQSGTGAANSASADVDVNTTAGTAGGTNVGGVVGTKTGTEPTSGYYLRMDASASGSSQITSAGWMAAGSLPAATASGTEYFPVAAGAATVGGTNTVTPSASISGSNVTMSSTDNGISVTATGGGTARAAVSGTATTAGFIPSGASLGTANVDASSTTTSAVSYITGITVPTDTGFAVTTTADEELDDTSTLVITNNAYRKVYVTNNANGSARVIGAGETRFDVVNSSSGELTVSAYYTNNDRAQMQIVNNGRWVEPSVTSSGTYYGRVIVDSNNLINEVLPTIYPVNSFYSSTSGTNPSVTLGFGTWELIRSVPYRWLDVSNNTWYEINNDSEWSFDDKVTDTVYVFQRTA